MKKIYLFILYLMSISYSNASSLQYSVGENSFSQHTIQRQKRFTPTPSETGSFTGSIGGTSTIISRHGLYTPPPEVSENVIEMKQEYTKLMAAYSDLLKITSATDSRLSQFLGAVEKALPCDLERSSADEESLTSLQTAFKQLFAVYRTLKKTYDQSTGQVTVLESTIEELKSTLATMAPRPTKHIETDMSPARKADMLLASDAKEIEALRLNNSELEAEIQRLKTENASLKAAQKAAESSAKSRTSTSEDNVRTPLLATGATSSKQNGGQGCPCSIM